MSRDNIYVLSNGHIEQLAVTYAPYQNGGHTSRSKARKTCSFDFVGAETQTRRFQEVEESICIGTSIEKLK